MNSKSKRIFKKESQVIIFSVNISNIFYTNLAQHLLLLSEAQEIYLPQAFPSELSQSSKRLKTKKVIHLRLYCGDTKCGNKKEFD